MENKAYKKSIIREIKSSKARFISILAIVFLGVAFYSGIKSSGPDLERSIDDFFREQNLMDSKIVSSLGLNENDLKLLENNNKILDYFATHSIDVNLTNENSVVKFMEYNKENKMNKLVVTEGRLPQNSGEIALDEKALEDDKSLNIGGNYAIESNKDTQKYFNRKTFKIVGFVKSPMYIDNMSRGITNVGKGTIDYFAILNSLDLSMDAYTEIYVRFKNVKNISTYSDEYDGKMEENNKYLEDLYSDRSVDRIEEVKLDAQKEIDKAYKDLEDGQQKLDDAQKEINEGKKKLLDGKKEYELGVSKFSKEIKNGKQDLIQGKKTLDEGEKKLNKQKEIFLEGERQLNLAKKDLDKAKKNFINQGIDPTKSTKEYENKIDSLEMLLTTYNGLSNDIKSTVNNLDENEKISNGKIESWKNVISNPNLGLSGLNNLINNLQQNPTNTSLALNISKSIENGSKSLNENKNKLQTLVGGIVQYQQGAKTYQDEVNKFNKGKRQLEEAQKEIERGRKGLEKGKLELEKGKQTGQSQLDKAKKEIERSEQKLIDGEKEIEKNKKELEYGKKEVDKEKEKLNNLDDSEYYFSDRSDNPGFSTYRSSIQSLDKIASVFPVFFFLVAALICLTTMTRMVEENRIEIGTLKALGYKNLEIAKKFIVYSSLASIVGSILGILVGSSILPYIISEAYSGNFALPTVKIYYYSSYIIQSLVVSIICTMGAALVVLKGELRENPSNLMRTKAPKLGKKIFLERITTLWKRFSFNQKVTFRNLFRYKQRMLMTIFGIAGCMAMLVAGLALQKSTSSVMDIQFNQLTKYDALVVFNENSSKKEDEQYNKSLHDLNGYENSLNIYQESVTFEKENMNKQNAFMYVPEKPTNLNKYISLNDRKSKVNYKLSDNGVIISEKLAKLLNASVGDEIILTDSNNTNHKVKVDNIVENYANHYVYLSPTYYKKIFKSKVEYNSQLLNFNSSVKDEEKIATTLMNNDKVINVSLASTMKTLSESADLGLVMVVIIVASGGLAFVVLYNLININIGERIREISTIKVLGFYDNEVDMYIFRENIILTILGVVAGSFLGKILYAFLVSVAELDTMMMIPTVYAGGYIIAGLITMFFATLVMMLMHTKLKNINMIDALKSIE